MNFSLSLDLLLYGLVLIALSLVAHRIAPDFVGATLTIYVTGGLFIVFLGILGLRGFRRRAWPMVTLTIIAVLLLAQAVKACFMFKADVEGLKPLAAILLLLLMLALGQLVNLAQSESHLRIPSGKNTDNASNNADMEGQRPQPTRPAPDE